MAELELPEQRSIRKVDPACEARREAILAAATDLFAEHGYSDAVTQALVERLQIGKGTLYRHFPSKRELFLAAADRVMRKLRERIDAKADGIDDSLEQAQPRARGVPRVLRREPALCRAVDPGTGAVQGPQDADLPGTPQGNVVPWHDRYRVLIAEGTIPRHAGRADHRRDQRPRVRHGLHELLRRRPQTLRGPGEDILDVVFFGILSDAERHHRIREGLASQTPRSGEVTTMSTQKRNQGPRPMSRHERLSCGSRACVLVACERGWLRAAAAENRGRRSRPLVSSPQPTC